MASSRSGERFPAPSVEVHALEQVLEIGGKAEPQLRHRQTRRRPGKTSRKRRWRRAGPRPHIRSARPGAPGRTGPPETASCPELVQAQPQAAQGLILTKDVADFHGAAGVTSLPAAAIRTGHMRVAFFTPRCSARAIRGVVDCVRRPVADALQGGGMAASSMAWETSGFVLDFFVGEALHAVVRQLVEEIHLLRDLGQLLTAGLEQGGHGGVTSMAGFFTASRI